MDFPALLYFLSAASVAAPLWTGRKVRGFLWYYALLSGLCDGLAYLPVFPQYSHWTGNIFLVGQFVLVNAYFIRELVPAQRCAGAWGLVGGIAAAFVVYTLGQDFWVLNYPAGAVLYGLLIIPVIGGFYDIMRREEIVYLESSPFFIFCAAFLLYVAGSFLIMVFAPRFVAEDHRSLILMWVSIHNSLNILKNLAIARALHLYTHPPAPDVRP